MRLSLHKSTYIILCILVLLFSYNNCTPSFTSNNDQVEIESIDDLGNTPSDPTKPPSFPPVPITESGNTELQALKQTYQCHNEGYLAAIKENTFKILNKNLGLLTKRQYEYSIEAIFGIQFYAENELPLKYSEGSYNNVFGSTFVSDDTILAHMSNAQAVVDKVKSQKPDIFSCAQDSSTCLSQFIGKYGPLLFRRPLALSEVNKIKDVASESQSNTRVMLEQSLYLMLVSPHFIYHIHGLELGVQDGSMQSINEYDLLSRLSFFIWGSGPDEYLLEKAKKNLVKKELAEIVNYMIDAPGKPKYLARELAYNWFGMGILRNSEIDLSQVAQGLNSSQVKFNFAEQVQHFLNWMIKENRPVTDIFQSNTMFQNKKTAKIYGISENGFDENAFKLSTSNDDDKSAGLLSHRGLWANKASNGEVHVIKRGTWVMDNFLCSEPVGPPSGTLLDDLPETASIKEQINSLSKGGSACAGCHKKFDHYGKALEVFDSLGGLRTTYAEGESVVYNAEVGQHRISTLKELGRYMASEKKEQMNYCATKNMLTLFLGKDLFDYSVELSNPGFFPSNQAGSCYTIDFYDKYLANNSSIGMRDLIISIVTNGIDSISKVAKTND